MKNLFKNINKKIIIYIGLILIIILTILILLSNNKENKSYAAVTYMYDKVKEDVITNGYGSTYTGDHADTVKSDGTAIVGSKPIYYYQTEGHNNVHFGDYCWQIVRTTDTGGIKLLYNGTYSSSTKCNNSGTERQLSDTKAFNGSADNRLYVGYMYKNGSTYNSTSSIIKTYIDNWYSSNMTSLESYLEDTVFCNDRTGSTTESSAATGTEWAGDSSTSAFYYHNYDSNYSKLFCDNEKDRFSTNNSQAQLSHPIGLITHPEAQLLDSTTKNTGKSWWLLSPYIVNVYGGAGGRRVDASVTLAWDGVRYSNGVRPSVSLSKFNTYSSGTGSVSDPYELGDLELPERNSYLYDTIKQDATELGWGGEYTDTHADTVEDDGTAIVGDEKIYYYTKGNHNNVKLGDYCWQIVRTTDTGGVKLLYNGTYSSSSKCNNSGTGRQIGTSMFNGSYGNRLYVGYKYKSGSTYNSTDSTIKTYIDNWYSSNMTSLESYLEDTVFCNDRTGSTSYGSAATGTEWAGDSSTSAIYYHNYDDNYNKLFCDNEKDRFSTNNSQAQLSHPIGLITQPEYKLLDSTTRNTGQYWWLLSPYHFDSNYGADVRGVNSYGLISNTVYYSNSLVRPSVSLVPDVKYSSGSGSVTDPYIVDSIGIKVTYKSGSNGTLSGTTTEEIEVGGHPTGRDVTPNNGYNFAGWVANKNVTLSNNDTINKGTLMTKEQTQSIVVNSSIILTAKYYKGWLYDQVKTDATTNSYGGTYTGEHADSVQNDGTAIVGDEKIYYYTESNHNNVKLGNFCWQIVRTTDTGGIKLVYNGVYSNDTKCNNSGENRQIGTSEFNSNYYDRIHVGYKYKSGSTYNSTDSTIKTYIDNWYSSNMTNLESYLEDTVFCNDRTGSTDSSSAATGTTWVGDSSSGYFYYHNYDDNYSKLFCDNEKDRFSTNNSQAQFSHPIGLITQSEYKLLDSTTRNTGQYWWLLSPHAFLGSIAVVRVADDSGLLNYFGVSFDKGVRPSISLAPNITFEDGSGTTDDPYIVGDIVNPEITATFYYQSSTTSGTQTISSKTETCTPSNGSCEVTIPSEVKNSVGKYNNSYAGLSTNVGTMSTSGGASKNDNSVTITGDTSFYATYSSSVTNYYYN